METDNTTIKIKALIDSFQQHAASLKRDIGTVGAEYNQDRETILWRLEELKMGVTARDKQIISLKRDNESLRRKYEGGGDPTISLDFQDPGENKKTASSKRYIESLARQYKDLKNKTIPKEKPTFESVQKQLKSIIADDGGGFMVHDTNIWMEPVTMDRIINGAGEYHNFEFINASVFITHSVGVLTLEFPNGLIFECDLVKCTMMIKYSRLHTLLGKRESGDVIMYDNDANSCVELSDINGRGTRMRGREWSYNGVRFTRGGGQWINLRWADNDLNILPESMSFSYMSDDTRIWTTHDKIKVDIHKIVFVIDKKGFNIVRE